jgi:hypothetical protein
MAKTRSPLTKKKRQILREMGIDKLKAIIREYESKSATNDNIKYLKDTYPTYDYARFYIKEVRRREAVKASKTKKDTVATEPTTSTQETIPETTEK